MGRLWVQIPEPSVNSCRTFPLKYSPIFLHCIQELCHELNFLCKGLEKCCYVFTSWLYERQILSLDHHLPVYCSFICAVSPCTTLTSFEPPKLIGPLFCIVTWSCVWKRQSAEAETLQVLTAFGQILWNLLADDWKSAFWANATLRLFYQNDTDLIYSTV